MQNVAYPAMKADGNGDIPSHNEKRVKLAIVTVELATVDAVKVEVCFEE